MEQLKVFTFSDVSFHAETLTAALTGEPWIDSARWQTGIDVRPGWDHRWRPHVVLVMCDPDIRPRWIRTLVGETGVRVVAVGISSAESDVISSAEAGACGYFFEHQPITQLRDVVRAALRDEVICPPSVVAALVRRVRTLAEQHDGTSGLGRLTRRECEILELIAAGQSNKEIAETLAIDLCTVKNHVHHIIVKLGVSRRGQAAALLRAQGHSDRRGRAWARVSDRVDSTSRPSAFS